jgi:hypothetical protein
MYAFGMVLFVFELKRVASIVLFTSASRGAIMYTGTNISMHLLSMQEKQSPQGGLEKSQPSFPWVQVPEEQIFPELQSESESQQSGSFEHLGLQNPSSPQSGQEPQSWLHEVQVSLPLHLSSPHLA